MNVVVENLRRRSDVKLTSDDLLRVTGKAPELEDVVAALRRMGVVDVRHSEDDFPDLSRYKDNGDIIFSDERDRYTHARIQHVGYEFLYFQGTDVSPVRAILSAYRAFFYYNESSLDGYIVPERFSQGVSTNPDTWLASFRSIEYNEGDTHCYDRVAVDFE